MRRTETKVTVPAMSWALGLLAVADPDPRVGGLLRMCGGVAKTVATRGRPAVAGSGVDPLAVLRHDGVVAGFAGKGGHG